MDDIPVARAVTPVAGDSNAVLGVPIDDENLRGQVKRVLLIAILMGLGAVITGGISIGLNEDYSGGFIASFAIPICGYMAIKNKSRSCLRAFVVWNGICSVLWVLSAVIVATTTLPTLKCICNIQCEPTVRVSGIPSGALRANLTSWQSLCSRENEIVRGYTVALVIGAITAVLQCLGCIFGKQLEGNTYFAVGPMPLGVPIAVLSSTPWGVQPVLGQYPGHYPGYAVPNSHVAYGGYTTHPHLSPQLGPGQWPHAQAYPAQYTSYAPGPGPGQGFSYAYPQGANSGPVMSTGGTLNYGSSMMAPPPGVVMRQDYGPTMAGRTGGGGSNMNPDGTPARPRCEPA